MPLESGLGCYVRCQQGTKLTFTLFFLENWPPIKKIALHMNVRSPEALLAGIRIRIRRAGLIRIPFGFGFGEWAVGYSDSDFYSVSETNRIPGAAKNGKTIVIVVNR